MRTLLLTLALLCSVPTLTAQRILLLEKTNSAQTAKVYEGETLKFRMEGDDFWQSGPIREMRPDIQALVINDRFILLEEIEIVHRGKTFAAAAGYSLMTFGAAWSIFAGLGYNTDGDPNSQYGAMDLGVTAVSIGSGFLLNKLLGQNKFRVGKKRRLRIVDINF